MQPSSPKTKSVKREYRFSTVYFELISTIWQQIYVVMALKVLHNSVKGLYNSHLYLAYLLRTLFFWCLFLFVCNIGPKYQFYYPMI